MLDFDKLTPKQIVEELDKYIIGQDKAKRTVAMALRNRVRRKMLPESLREEVIPKNIIMIGSTGVGKTEIARRLSKLSGAPFVKVEATKYTEVGYVGRDVESIIRDLMSVAVNMVKTEMRSTVMEDAKVRVEEQLLDLLLPGDERFTVSFFREADFYHCQFVLQGLIPYRDLGTKKSENRFSVSIPFDLFCVRIDPAAG